jgi:hypothetical protein
VAHWGCVVTLPTVVVDHAAAVERMWLSKASATELCAPVESQEETQPARPTGVKVNLRDAESLSAHSVKRVLIFEGGQGEEEAEENDDDHHRIYVAAQLEAAVRC